MRQSWNILRGLALVVMVGAASCKSESAGTTAQAPSLPRLTEVERSRATEACDDYVNALCACARNRPTLQPTCDLDVSLKQGVATMLKVEALANEPDKLRMAQHQLQRMTATCVERRAQLGAQGCP